MQCSQQLSFYPEDGGNVFLQNVKWFSTDYMKLYPRRQDSPHFYVKHFFLSEIQKLIAIFLSSQITKFDD
jgi:hypothetical protein